MNESALPEVTIFCDGACQPNPGWGGIGAVLIFGEHRKELSESIGRATNNAAEIEAAIRALNALRHPCKVTLYSDSKYLIQTMRGEFQRGTNLELWDNLDLVAARHEINWCHLRGHQGQEDNERADRLAKQAARRLS